jgi:hypothetical protein
MIEVSGVLAAALVYALCGAFMYRALKDGEFTWYFSMLSDMVVSRQRHPRTFWLIMAASGSLIVVVTLAAFATMLP